MIATSTSDVPAARQAAGLPLPAAPVLLARSADPPGRAVDPDTISFGPVALRHAVLGAADEAVRDLDGAADAVLARLAARDGAGGVASSAWDRLSGAVETAALTMDRMATHLGREEVALPDRERTVDRARSTAIGAASSLDRVAATLRDLAAWRGAAALEAGPGPVATERTRDGDREPVAAVSIEDLVRANALQPQLSRALDQTLRVRRRLDDMEEGRSGHAVAGASAWRPGGAPWCPVRMRVRAWLARGLCLLVGFGVLRGLDRGAMRWVAFGLASAAALVWVGRRFRPRRPLSGDVRLDPLPSEPPG